MKTARSDRAEAAGDTSGAPRSLTRILALFDLPDRSDKDEAVCQLFDVIKQKKLYGKEYLGVDRSTFLIDEEGVVRDIWRKVKVKGHAEDVLDAVHGL